jgi:hypothetical protein
MMGSWVRNRKAPRTRRNENETLCSDFNVVGGRFDGAVHHARRDRAGGSRFEDRSGQHIDRHGEKAFEEAFDRQQDCDHGREEACRSSHTGEVIQFGKSGRVRTGWPGTCPARFQPTRATSSMWTGGL